MTDCDTDSSTDVLRNEEKMELVIKGLFILVVALWIEEIVKKESVLA